MALDSLEGLFQEELRDILHAENQILRALPQMTKAATNEQLRAAFEEHLEQSRGHVRRLERVFQSIGKKPRTKVCHGMAGLIEEGKELMKENAEPAVLDAGLIAAAQHVEHYEMASYGTLRTYAQELGYREAVGLLEQTLEEEKMTDLRLTEIAESVVNIEAEEGEEGQGRSKGSSASRSRSR